MHLLPCNLPQPAKQRFTLINHDTEAPGAAKNCNLEQKHKGWHSWGRRSTRNSSGARFVWERSTRCKLSNHGRITTDICLQQYPRNTYSQSNCTQSENCNSWSRCHFCNFPSRSNPWKPQKKNPFTKRNCFKWENHTADLKLNSREWRKSMYLAIHQSLVTCGNTTSKETDFVKRCTRVHFSTASFFHHTILAEGRDSKEVVNWLPIQSGEPRLLVWQHHTTIKVVE